MPEATQNGMGPGGIDLHAHTTASDGSLSPTELVQKAAGIGLAALAVTDHDTLGGLAEARAAADEAGIETDRRRRTVRGRRRRPVSPARLRV